MKALQLVLCLVLWGQISKAQSGNYVLNDENYVVFTESPHEESDFTKVFETRCGLGRNALVRVRGSLPVGFAGVENVAVAKIIDPGLFSDCKKNETVYIPNLDRYSTVNPEFHGPFNRMQKVGEEKEGIFLETKYIALRESSATGEHHGVPNPVRCRLVSKDAELTVKKVENGRVFATQTDFCGLVEIEISAFKSNFVVNTSWQKWLRGLRK